MEALSWSCCCANHIYWNTTSAPGREDPVASLTPRPGYKWFLKIWISTCFPTMPTSSHGWQRVWGFSDNLWVFQWEPASCVCSDLQSSFRVEGTEWKERAVSLLSPLFNLHVHMPDAPDSTRPWNNFPAGRRHADCTIFSHPEFRRRPMQPSTVICHPCSSLPFLYLPSNIPLCLCQVSSLPIHICSGSHSRKSLLSITVVPLAVSLPLHESLFFLT